MVGRLEKGQKKGTKNNKRERMLRAFTIFNLVDALDELKEQGYFYLKEWVRLEEGEGIWSGSEDERPELNVEWLQWQALQPITAIQMVFEHFLTGEKKYLYIRKEALAYGNDTVMWISDSIGELNDNARTDSLIRDRPPVLKDILQEMEMIPELGVFQKISVEALQEQTKGSLFSMLYSLGFRQLREGWGKVKEDRFEEESIAWAGEFEKYRFLEWEYDFLYLVMIKREYEEWGANCDGESYCTRREAMLDIYMARSREPMDDICLADEKPIQLTAIHGVEEIRAYLDTFSKVDRMLTMYKNENEMM